MLAMSRVMSSAERRELLSPALAQPGAEQLIAAAVTDRVDPRRDSVLSQTLELDREMALVDSMFLYFDKMSMAASLEVRVPFMDHDVVAFCAALPDDRRMWRARRKELLKRASAGLVDDAIINKKKRAFFVGAMGTWLRTHRDTIFRDTLLDERALDRGLFERAPMERLLAADVGTSKAARRLLLSILLLEKWHRLFVDGDGRGRELARSGTA
jgi:asparagine synthase (glutamine-hydrolysing)